MMAIDYIMLQIVANAVGGAVGLFIGWVIYTVYEKWIEK